MSRVGIAAVVLVTAGATPVLAAGGSSGSGSYTLHRPYVAGGLGSVDGATPTVYGEGRAQDSSMQAVSLPTRTRDRWLRVRVADSTGRAVLFSVVQTDSDAAGSPEQELAEQCGKSDRRLRLAKPGRPVTVYLLYGSCGAVASVPTSGTVTATLSRR